MTGADSVHPGSPGDGDAIDVLHVEDDRAFAERTAIRLKRDGRPDADAAVVRERLAALLAEARELSPRQGERRATATREADD